MSKPKSKSKLIKENRELNILQKFIHMEMMHDIPKTVLTKMACEAYAGKISAEQFFGGCRFMDYFEEEMMNKKFWEKETNDEQSRRYFFTKWGRMIDAPTNSLIKHRKKIYENND